MVIPVWDRNPVRRTPVVTWLLIAVNVGVFLVTPVAGTALGDGGAARICRSEAFYQRYGAEPRELIRNQADRGPVPTGEVVRDRFGRPVACVAAPPTYDKIPALSVLTAMFLHGSWLHLLGNMLFLFVFGNNVEDRLGRLRYLLFYLLCGYVATYAFAAASPDSTTTLVGASGAIAGVLGAYLVLYPRVRVISLIPFLLFLPFPLPAWLVLGSWFLLQWMYASGVAVTQATGVAYLAHVAGFVVGALLALPLRARGQPRRTYPQPPPPRPYW